MNSFSKIAVKVTALVAVIMFFFPLCSVSCSGMMSVDFTGVDLAMGKTLELPDLGMGQEEVSEKIDGSPLVLAAIILAGFALLCALILSASRIFGILAAISSIVSLAIMIIVMIGIDKKVTAEAGMLATVNLRIPYYILLLSLAATAVTGFLSAKRRSNTYGFY